MSTITCLKELEEKGVLESEDIVIFTINKEIIKYNVRNLYLQNFKSTSTCYNDEIFRILEIDKYEIIKKTYKDNIIRKRYTSTYWPETKNINHPALTRLVAEIYRIIKERNPVYTKFTRFEIMEI